jgi:hypothetical protein
MEARQNRRHAANAKRERKGDPDAASRSVRVRRNGPPGIGDIRQDASPALGELTRGIGRSDAPGTTGDKRRSEVGLNSRNAPTDNRLRHAKPLRGLVDPPGLYNRYKRSQVVQVHHRMTSRNSAKIPTTFNIVRHTKSASGQVLVHASARPVSRRLARVLAVCVAAIGGLSLSEYAFGLDLGIDQLIVGASA